MGGLKLGAAAVLAATGVARADSYAFTVDPGQSSLSFSVQNGVHIEGALIGNYDPQDNPGGTQTRNGYFGGHGNEQVAYTADATVDGDGQTSPVGGFTFDLGTANGSMTIRGLRIDLLNGATPQLPLTVALDFDTFRTFNPDSLYIGGILPPVEVGQATLTALAAAQSGAGGGTLTPSGDNQYSFDAAVATDVTLAMSVLGQDVAPGAQPAPLALSGTITINQDGTASVAMALDQEIKQQVPLEGLEFQDVPVDLPTILPPGQTAHLLLSGAVQTVSVDMTFGLAVAAEGVPLCAADINGDGVLDLFDFLAFVNAFVAREPGADFNGDGSWDLFDFLAFVNAFDAGC